MSHGSEQPVPVAPPPRPAPAPSSRPPRPLFPWVFSALGIALLAAAWVVTGGGLGAAVEPAAPTPAPPEPATKEELAALKVLVGGLGEGLGQLRAGQGDLARRLEALPKPPPPVDLGPLEARIDALAEQLVAQGTAAGKDVAAIREELAALKDAVARAQAGLAALEEQVQKPAVAAAPTPAPEPEQPRVAGAEFQKALGLFRQRQYAQAVAEFRRLREQFPDDARLWYYAALSNGFATRNWEGETVQLANKGAELERAGTPDKAAIDAALAELTPQTAQWIAAFRGRAR